jgi:hypothetical protein
MNIFSVAADKLKKGKNIPLKYHTRLNAREVSQLVHKILMSFRQSLKPGEKIDIKRVIDFIEKGRHLDLILPKVIG